MNRRRAKPVRPRGVSRKRYDRIETQRSALLNRLFRLGEPECTHPGYNRAFILLNQRFRTATIDQRIELLKAVAWLIELIEKGSGKP